MNRRTFLKALGVAAVAPRVLSGLLESVPVGSQTVANPAGRSFDAADVKWSSVGAGEVMWITAITPEGETIVRRGR